MFVCIQQHIDEGNASQYSIDVLQDLEKLAGILREHMVNVDQDGTVIQRKGDIRGGNFFQ